MRVDNGRMTSLGETHLPQQPPAQRRDPLPWIVAGTVVVLVVGLIVAGLVVLRVLGGASGSSPGGETLPSCDQLNEQAQEWVARISAAPDGTAEYDAAIEGMGEVVMKNIAQDCPPLS